MADLDISKHAMLVSLSIHAWKARKFDRKVTEQTLRANNANDRAGRFNKNLLPFEAPAYQLIGTCEGQAREAHKRLTLPTGEDGSRILPTANYEHYTDTMREQRRRFDTAWPLFLQDYSSLRTRAAQALGTMYKDEDFPTEANMRGRFSFEIRISPMPRGEDLRIELANVDMKAMRAEVERQTREVIAEAMKEPYRRLHAVVKHMAERANASKGTFKEAVVENIRDLCNELPRLNITNDPELTETIEWIQQTLTPYTAKQIRKRSAVRLQVARSAEQITRDLAGLMGGV